MLAMTASLTMIFGTPDVLKKALADSGVYDSFVADSLDTALKQEGQGTEDIPLDRPEIKSAVQSAFSPELTRKTVEEFIDGTYDWLEGKTASPSFNIDLSAPKQQLITSLADYAATRTQSLPPCSLQQLSDLRGSDVDPFNAGCRPPGLTETTVRQKVIADLEGSEEFLKEPVVNSASLPKDEEGKTIFQQAEQAPGIFQKSKTAPYAFAFIAAITASGVILLNEERRRGIRIVGFSFITVGAIVLISTWLVSFAMNRAKQPGGSVSRAMENNFQDSLLNIVSHLTSALNGKLYAFCFAYIMLGIGILVTLKLTGQKQPNLVSAPATSTPQDQPDAGIPDIK